MNNAEIILLTKEEAMKIAKIENNQIHCIINPGVNMLVGADHSYESFMNDLETAKEIEVGGEHCRKMGHALVLWKNNEPYFYEHNEEKLMELLNLKEEGK